MAPRRKKTQSTKFSCSSSIDFSSVPTAASSPLQKIDFMKVFATKFKNYENGVNKEIDNIKEELILEFKRSLESFKIEIGPTVGNLPIPYESWSKDVNLEALYVQLLSAADENNHSSVFDTPESQRSPAQEPQTVFRKPPPKTAEKPTLTQPQHLCTPANQGQPTGSSWSIAMVTPGPMVQRPFSIMRKPMQGEVAISLSGSPLMVATDLELNGLPQVNVPLQDGKIISILPRDGFQECDVPSLNENTRRQLSVLRSYIDKFLEKKES